ncbi:hypothetical protein N7G274_006932 [Stereocaulon virgatum]|uniref:Uncharacterized protein n=1 Tax=Stereocaulon virgatum TaxID=373712 RepID=A0ABR4A6V2_9LECA
MHDAKNYNQRLLPHLAFLELLGPMSVLAAPLLRTTDVPQEIAKIEVVDPPIIDLLSDFDELYSGHGSSIQFTRLEVPIAPITRCGPTRLCTIYAKLGRLYGET